MGMLLCCFHRVNALRIKNKHSCLLASFLLFPVSVSASSNQSVAQVNVEVFDGYCFQNYDNYSNIKYMVEAYGGKKIPEKLLKADPTLRNLGGNGYAVQYKGQNYMIGYAENAGCSVATNNLDSDHVIELLNEFYSLKLAFKDANGTQTTEMYQMTGDSIHNGAILSVMYAKPETGMNVGTISFIPAEVVKRQLNRG